MTGNTFASYRKYLKKTQKEMALLMGASVKTVRSYEQGWRKIPSYVEKHLYFLAMRKKQHGNTVRNCWEIMNCASGKREKCPAWEFKTGDSCWFINGTICNGKVQKDWQDKINICKKCLVLKSHLPDDSELNKETT